MATQCKLQLLNCTNQGLTGDVSYSYQMSDWAFGKTPNRNFTTYDITFDSGTHDEDDEGKAEFSNDNGNIWLLHARTHDEKSVHFLEVIIQGGINRFAVAICSEGSILSERDPKNVSWYKLQNSDDPRLIGNISTNGQYFGLALVDLDVLFDKDRADKLWNAIYNNSLTYQDEYDLMKALQKQYSPVLAGENTLAIASR
jgi:hypothetical protein